MIVKIQKPLSSSDDAPALCLIYNKDRSMETFCIYDEGMEEHVFKGREKVYCEAEVREIDGNRNLNVKQEVEEQDW